MCLTTVGLLLALLALARAADAQAPAFKPAGNNSAGSPAGLLDRVIRVDVDAALLPDAVDEIARSASARISYSRELLGDRRVSLRHRSITVGAALAEALGDSNLDLSVEHDDLIVLAPRAEGHGSPLFGVVTDGATGAPLEGASLLVSGKVAAITDYAGRFAGVRRPLGAGLILVKKIGYVARGLSFGDDSGTGAAFHIALQPAPLPLDRVVVMGALNGSVEQSLPSAVTVLTGATLDALRLASVDDLFRGLIPGVVGWDDGPSSLTSHLGSVRGAASFSVNYFKTYVDGVEVAAPFLGSMVDPSTIQRIEVIRGPQGAALHGSDASSGVIHIVTRDGRGAATGRPYLAVSAAQGRMNSRFVSNPAPTRELSGSIGGANEMASFLLGATRQTTGEYVPGTSVSQRSAHGKLHAAIAAASVDLQLQESDVDGGSAVNPILVEIGIPLQRALTNPVRVARHRTAGATVKLAPSPRVNVLATAGYDRSSLEGVGSPVPYISASDSMLLAARGASTRKSVRLATDITPAALGLVAPTMSFGYDVSRLRHDRDAVHAEGKEISPAAAEFESGYGVFGQLSVSLRQIVFLTAGLRGERNTSFGNAYGVARLPLLGAAVVGDLGPVTLKTRASYGKGIRPPPIDADQLIQLADLTQRANPQLAPESQSGVELGFDAYFGERGFLKLTHYEQLAEGLIQQVMVDGESHPRAVQQQNIGTIRNAGWEAEGDGRIGWVTLLANYARTDSRVRSIAPRYTGTLRPGDRMLEVPDWTASATTIIGGAGRSASLGLWRVGSWTNYDWIALYTAVLNKDPNRGPPRSYWIRYPGFTQVRAAARGRIGETFEIFVRGDNLTNVQNAGRDNLHVNTGRTVTVGLSARY